MGSFMSGLAQALRNLWLRLTAPGDPPPQAPPVIVHDPSAQRAHDLDDAFFDDKVQTRIADVIAHAGHKE